MQDSDVFEPDREAGSVLMSFGDTEKTTGLLLLPPKGRKPISLGAAGAAEPRLRVVGRGATGRSPDGLTTAVDAEEGFEAALKAEVATSPAWVVR